MKKAYKIYFCDLAKAINNPLARKRPVVSVGVVDGKHKVYAITSRYKAKDFHYVHMNQYMVNGYCNISENFLIDEKYLLNYWRDCTTSEMAVIDAGAKRFGLN